MHVLMDIGRQRLDLEVAESNRIASRPPPAALPDVAAAVRAALESPFVFPPLRRALTPDDRLAVVLDEPLPQFLDLLVPLLDHVLGAGVSPTAITLLCPPGSRSEWVDDLPEELEEVHVEVHDPADRRRLAYLATTGAGKRLYLNRTAVEADQVVVVTSRRYDTLLGYAGGEGALYPALADEATRQEMAGRAQFGVPGEGAWPVRQEAIEATWLLGQPFFVQVIPGPGDSIAHIVAGAAEACREGQRLLDVCWRQIVPRAADVVVAGLGGDPRRHTFADLAAALACAARVVRAEGRIVLLTDACPALGPGTDVLRGHDDPPSAVRALQRKPQLGMGPALQWAHSAEHARLSVLSGLPGETIEELFATPLSDVGQVQRLIAAGGACLFLDDTHKMLALVG
jgi:nickel-dependent lactate racemase